MAVLETRAHGEVPAVVGQRPGTGGQGNDSECKHSSPFPRPPACTRGERRPRHSSFPVGGWTAAPFQKRRGARWNRRAPGASSGGTFGRDKRSRLEWTNVPPVGGDRQIADCSAGNPRYCRLRSTTTSLRPSRLCGEKPDRSVVPARLVSRVTPPQSMR